jgi:hypothetical protein
MNSLTLLKLGQRFIYNHKLLTQRLINVALFAANGSSVFYIPVNIAVNSLIKTSCHIILRQPVNRNLKPGITLFPVAWGLGHPAHCAGSL